MEEYITIIFHKNVAKSQREAYKKHLTLPELRNKILIELDYKQKIKIGMSPRQISSEYYEQKERTCLGFMIYRII